MKLTRRTFAATAGALALSAGTRRLDAAEAPIVIKFSHVVSTITPKHKGAVRFQELAAKYTGGKVKVEIYPQGTLYKDKEEIEALQLGTVHMLAPATAKFASLGAKEFEALDLPYLFADTAAAARVSRGPTGKWLMDKLAPNGFLGLAFWDNGFFVASANKPLINPEDFQGLKLRISGSKVADNYFRQLGAIPQIMAFGEVYQALQTGVVDGTENSPSNYYSQKFQEVQKHISVSNHTHLQYAVIVNAKFWNTIPPDIRAELDKAMEETTVYVNSIAQQENDDALEGMRASGKTEIHVLTAEQRKAWSTAMAPTYKWAEGRVGKEIIAMLKKDTAS